jgi:hypothetical protein
MKRLTWFVSSILLITSGCSFDLTEVRVNEREPRISVLIEATRGSDTRVRIHIDPGVSDRGVSRTLVQESVVLDGVAYPPTERVHEWRVYELMVPEATPSIGIVLPSITGMAEVPAIVAAPLRVAAADTIEDSGGVLEIPILGTEAGEAANGGWTAGLHVAGTTASYLSVGGTHPIPAVLRIPTIHLSPEVRSGHVEVSGALFMTFPAAHMPDITIQRFMRASVQFRMPD